jgi:hypothetical protein
MERLFGTTRHERVIPFLQQPRVALTTDAAGCGIDVVWTNPLAGSRDRGCEIGPRYEDTARREASRSRWAVGKGKSPRGLQLQ